MNDQMLILVDENDNFLGKYSPKSQCHTGKGLHHRAFTILILNEKNEVLLQERKHKIWNHFWDLTNSHPLHLTEVIDETYKEAASRCLKKEWGVDFPIKKHFAFNYFAQFGNFCENEYCVFMTGEYNGEICPNPEAVYEYKWIPLEKLLKDIKIHPKIYTPWLLKAFGELERNEKRKKLL